MTSTLRASFPLWLAWRLPKKVDLTIWIRSAKTKNVDLETPCNFVKHKKVDLVAWKIYFTPKKSTWRPEKKILHQKSRVGSLKKIFWAKKVDLGTRKIIFGPKKSTWKAEKKNFVANKLSWRSEKNVLHRKSRLDDFNPFSAAQKSWLGRPNPLGAGKKVDLTAQE